jgi:pilus assembly protein CpaC
LTLILRLGRTVARTIPRMVLLSLLWPLSGSVLEMNDDVSTVSIADPKVADAAVGSARTVVVNGKSAGVTSLVVWEEGGRHTLYRVTSFDANGSKQVLLQCKVAELNEQRLAEFGLDWIASGTSDRLEGTLSGGLFVTKVEQPGNPLVIGPTTDAFTTYRRADGSLTLLSTLRAMEQRGAARTLASPNLVALSGDSAAFLAGGEFPVPIANVSNNGVSVTIDWKQFGVRLGFVPTVIDSNRIRLFVSPEVSSPDNTHAVLLNGYIVPGLVTRRISTTVEMRDGDVLVIGGVKQREVKKITSKFPILGDIPLVSLLFKHSKTETLDRDLVIVVSPQIVRQLARTFPKNLPGEEREGGH